MDTSGNQPCCAQFGCCLLTCLLCLPASCMPPVLRRSSLVALSPPDRLLVLVCSCLLSHHIVIPSLGRSRLSKTKRARTSRLRHMESPDAYAAPACPCPPLPAVLALVILSATRAPYTAGGRPSSSSRPACLAGLGGKQKVLGLQNIRFVAETRQHAHEARTHTIDTPTRYCACPALTSPLDQATLGLGWHSCPGELMADLASAAAAANLPT